LKDGTVAVWDLKSKQLIKELKGHEEPVWETRITDDGHLAVTSSSDGTLRLWDIQEGSCLKVLRVSDHPVRDLAITPDGRRGICVTSTWPEEFSVWELQEGNRLCAQLTIENCRIHAVAITHDGRFAILSVTDQLSWKCGLEIRDIEAYCSNTQMKEGKESVGTSTRYIDTDTDKWSRFNINALAITPDGRQLLAMRGGRLVVWDLATWQPIQILESEKSERFTILVGDPRNKFVTASHGHQLAIWDRKSNAISASFIAESPLSACTIRADGVIFVGDRSGKVHQLRLKEAAV
jgi:WD40 repeat protein